MHEVRQMWHNGECIGLWVKTCQVNVLCSWVRHFSLTVHASLHPGVQMGTSKLSGKPVEMPQGNLAVD